MNRSCLLRTLQRPRAGLRKSARRSVSANNAAEAAHQQHTSAAAVAAAAAAGLTSGGLCSDEANDVNREIAILKKLDHPNVVKLFEVIDPPGSQYMMLVMEFLEKGPVLQTHNQSGFDSLPEEVAADFFRQAVLGLEYLHFHKVRLAVSCWWPQKKPGLAGCMVVGGGATHAWQSYACDAADRGDTHM